MTSRLVGRLSAALLLAAVFTSGADADVTAATGGIRFPAPAGTQWEVLAGYNTATHVDIDPYALDLWRTDGETGGTPVLSPVSGTIGFVSDSCVSVRTDDVNIMACHVFADAHIERGMRVLQGQRLGVVAPDGEAGNNGVAHIHLQINTSDRRGYGNGEPIPFAGDYALDGQELPAITTSNGYYRTSFVSTNDPSLARSSISAGADVSVAVGGAVTLQASGSNLESDYYWMQASGAVVEFNAESRSITFEAPSEPGTLTFEVYAAGLQGAVLSDSVTVTVGAAVAGGVAPAEGTPGGEPGRILGEVPAQGVGLVVYSGGSTEDLVAAVSCAGASFWATQGGTFVGYIVGAQVPLVNAGWTAMFPQGLPANMPLAVRCG